MQFVGSLERILPLRRTMSPVSRLFGECFRSLEQYKIKGRMKAENTGIIWDSFLCPFRQVQHRFFQNGKPSSAVVSGLNDSLECRFFRKGSGRCHKHNSFATSQPRKTRDLELYFVSPHGAPQRRLEAQAHSVGSRS